MRDEVGNTVEIERAPYERPAVELIGTLADLTRGQSSGSNLDDSFSAGTPYGDLTFS